MAEEVRNAATSIPNVLLWVYMINFVLNLSTILTLCYHLPSVPDALSDPTNYPAVYVMQQAMSTKWVSVLLAAITALILISSVSYFVAVSRQLYAFARDKGVPFSRWISIVDKRRQIPTNSYLLSGLISILLSLIYIGSPTAYYAMTSLSIVALLQCYLFCISCVLWRRIYYPKTIPHAQFSLGKWGIPMNCLAIIFTWWSFFWCFWPLQYPVTASGFNWSSVIFVAAVVLSAVYYLVAGRTKYAEPVASVVGRGTGD
jgi:choline transport protein